MVRAWSVTARGLASVQVRGRNWIVALGRGLDELGRADALLRLACEVLPNGTVIARDVSTGTGYVVQALEVVDPALFSEEQTGHDDQTSEMPMPMPTGEDELPGTGGPGGAGAEQQEDSRGEPIFVLPSDAIDALPDDGDPGYPVLDAATRLDACRLALEGARTAVGAESGAVILEERGTLRFFAVDGPAAEKLVGSRLPLGTGVAGFAMEKRRSVVLADARSDPRHHGEVDAMTGYVTQQMAVVPIVNGDRALGVLELMNLPRGRRFGEADLAEARRFADALAVRLGR